MDNYLSQGELPPPAFTGEKKADGTVTGTKTPVPIAPQPMNIEMAEVARRDKTDLSPGAFQNDSNV